MASSVRERTGPFLDIHDFCQKSILIRQVNVPLIANQDDFLGSMITRE